VTVSAAVVHSLAIVCANTGGRECEPWEWAVRRIVRRADQDKWLRLRALGYSSEEGLIRCFDRTPRSLVQSLWMKHFRPKYDKEEVI
jgi:hypothetical protein